MSNYYQLHHLFKFKENNNLRFKDCNLSAFSGGYLIFKKTEQYLLTNYQEAPGVNIRQLTKYVLTTSQSNIEGGNIQMVDWDERTVGK